MKYKSLCRVRTVTTFISLTKDISQWQGLLRKASQCCLNISSAMIAGGYQVQSLRIVTNPFGEYLDTTDAVTVCNDLTLIRECLNLLSDSGIRVRFAIGEAKTRHELTLLPAMIAAHGDLANACVNVGVDNNGLLNNDLIDAAAAVVIELGRTTPQGEGNFNFTVNFNCRPLIPYFPASYHCSHLPNQVVVGLETPDLLVHSLTEVNTYHGLQKGNQHYGLYYQAMRAALQHHVDVVVDLVSQVDLNGFHFAGLDSSAAPSKSCASMVEVYQLMGVDYFGAAGTVEASALLTRVFKSITGVELVGFSGLMLAVTEDSGLAAATRCQAFDIRALLTYSAICGIGLDTVPIPGDTPLYKISALMRDTGTMAYRLNKPLTVRLFPVPGLGTGDVTQFQSGDLCNSAVLSAW